MIMTTRHCEKDAFSMRDAYSPAANLFRGTREGSSLGGVVGVNNVLYQDRMAGAVRTCVYMWRVL